ncbi:MAG: urate hydroxylase PuuD [Gammaproteobacteria bacterium]|nr:urate hydroxylase PuuD [Gammaproteobacteria bacterium]MDH3469390.1 urate hydroxylase PuuD [Gammaproteobacteria bacterium]
MLDAYIIDWLNLLGRWVHMITGIAWIGASFYFVWLDNHLLPATQASDSDRGVGGELWAVHGGGFYHAQKYRVTPPGLPATLHWFKWEAYSTWWSGVFLLALMYWYGAEVYLIDPAVAGLSKPLAVIIGLGTLLGGWLAYDGLCRSRFGKDEIKLAAVLFLFVSIVTYLLCQVFSGRGAYIHFGAMLGTIMVANVFFVIIPGQKELVAASQEGRDPDPIHGINGKQRSVHNTYFTLPVLFAMISNHYALSYAHPYNWLILILISLAGALIRIYFVARHDGKASPAPLAAAVLLLAGVIVAIAPKPSADATANVQTPKELFAQVRSVIQSRCTSCHAASPTQAGFSAPPKGVVFDTAGQIVGQAAQIHQQTVTTQAMPIGNLTQMTAAERAVIAAWIEAGATTQ